MNIIKMVFNYCFQFFEIKKLVLKKKFIRLFALTYVIRTFVLILENRIHHGLKEMLKTCLFYTTY